MPALTMHFCCTCVLIMILTPTQTDAPCRFSCQNKRCGQGEQKNQSEGNQYPVLVLLYWLPLEFSSSSSSSGAGIAQWLERRTRDWKVADSNPCWSGGRMFLSMISFQCWLLFRYPFHPRVTAVARKRSRSFCQKCRWQVTSKQWFYMKWHGAWLYCVHRTGAVWCGTSHVNTVSTSLRWIFKKRAIKSYSLMQNHMRAQHLSLLESGE